MYGNTYEFVTKKTKKKVCVTNANVVPYNAFLSSKYKAQYVYFLNSNINFSINTELVAGQQCVKYVCKYVMKGATMAFVRMQQEGMKSDVPNPPIRYDEFHQIRLVRYITSMEAYLSLIGLPLVKRSHVVCSCFNIIYFSNFTG